ncbi:uncharacterized protein EI90DRAFT_3123550 [Cantharellus anzutake]|uniref:uncharacterized protein n=1 Tax=Cantharellus anzutake TaxID=1750568 RepID=UPI001905267E|nr:uncharacterized protein EI90DRAFT_3123550 [Cantharellus anzutake]KAF8331407.1 hypothetical protein EI90DRAFT_3123550 [Cantharellus anzutake]
MSTSLFLLSMTKPQRGGHSHAQPPAAHSHQSTGWSSGYSHPTRSSLSGTVTYPTSSGEGYGPGSSRMPGHTPVGPTSHGHPLPCTGPPARFPQQLPLPVRSHERQVTDSHQLGDSLWESQYPSLPVRSIEHQVTASHTLPAHPLPARSQERQVPISRQPGGSLKEPTSYSLPVRSQEHQVTVGRHTGYTARHSSHSVLPPMATQPPPLVSRTAQVGFPGTRPCNIGAPTPVAPSSNSIVRPRAHTQEDYSSNLGTVNSDYQYSTIPLKRALDEFSSPRRFSYERTPMDLLHEWQQLGPDDIEVQSFRKLATDSSTSYRITDERGQQLILILQAMDRFTQTISNSNLIPAMFKADPGQIILTTLITLGWTELSTLHRTWNYLQRKLADFVLHFEHVKEVLVLTQSRAASSRIVTTNPSLVPVRPCTPEVVAISPAAVNPESPSLRLSSVPDGAVAACASSTTRHNSLMLQSRQTTAPAQHSLEPAHPMVQLCPIVAGSLCAGHLTSPTRRKTELISLAARLVRPAADRSISTTGLIRPSRYKGKLPSLPIQLNLSTDPTQRLPELSHSHKSLHPDATCPSSARHLDGPTQHTVESTLPTVQTDQPSALPQHLFKVHCSVQAGSLIATHSTSMTHRMAESSSVPAQPVEATDPAVQLERLAAPSQCSSELARPIESNCSNTVCSLTELGPSTGPSRCLPEPTHADEPHRLATAWSSSARHTPSSTHRALESTFKRPTVQMDRSATPSWYPCKSVYSNELSSSVSTPTATHTVGPMCLMGEPTPLSLQLGSPTGSLRHPPEQTHSNESFCSVAVCRSNQRAVTSPHSPGSACLPERHRSVTGCLSMATRSLSATHHEVESSALPCQSDYIAAPLRCSLDPACLSEQSHSIVTGSSGTTCTAGSTRYKVEPASLPVCSDSVAVHSCHPFDPGGSSEPGSLVPTGLSAAMHAIKLMRYPANQALPLAKPERLHALYDSEVVYPSTARRFTSRTRRVVKSWFKFPIAQTDCQAAPSRHPPELVCLNEPDCLATTCSSTVMLLSSLTRLLAESTSSLVRPSFPATPRYHPSKTACSPGLEHSGVVYASNTAHCPHFPDVPLCCPPEIVCPHESRRSTKACSPCTTHTVAIARRTIELMRTQVQSNPSMVTLCRPPELVHLLEPYSSVTLVYLHGRNLPGADDLSSYSRCPHELGHCYYLYHPASAGSLIVTNSIVSTRQTIARSVGIGVRAHNKALSSEVDVPNPQLDGTQIMTPMLQDYANDAESNCLTIIPSFDGWTHKLSSLPAQLDPLTNPSHHPCELEHSCELHRSATAGLPITMVSSGLVGQVIEPMSSSAYIPTTMHFLDSMHRVIKLASSHDQLDSPAVPARRLLKLARSNGPTATHLPVLIPFIGSTCQSFQAEGRPIILIDAHTFNKAFECDIYLSNLQLGGTQIMHKNGVSHLVTLSGLEGTTLMWLSYDLGIEDDRLPITSPIDSWPKIACWHMPHRSATAHSLIVTHSIDSMHQRISRPIGIDARRIYLGHQSIQVKGQHIILTVIPVLNEDLNYGIHAANPQLGGTQLTTSMWLGCVLDVKGSRLPTTLPIDGWITSLAQPSYLTVTVCCPIEMMCSFESYSSSVVHLSTIASLQSDPPTDPPRNPITLARSRVPGHSGAGKSSSAMHPVDRLGALLSYPLKPECSCHLCHSVAAGRPIMMNHIRLPCQAVELTSSSTSSGSPTVSTHSFLKSAHPQSAHHSVAAHAPIMTCSTNSMRHTTESIFSHDWWDPPAVPACQLLELVRLNGLYCSAVAYPSITTHSAGTMRHAIGQVSLHDQPYPSAGHPPETAGVSACHVSGSSPLLASGGSLIVIKSTGSTRRDIIRSALMVAQALNQVLGCDIYTSKPFLGGIQITTLMWLGYVPGVRDGHLPTTPPINDWDPVQVYTRTVSAIGCTLRQANGVTGKDRYASWAVPDDSKLDKLRTAWSCSGPRPASSEGHYRYKNDGIKILGISLSAGRLNATSGNWTSLSISKETVVLTQPEDSQRYLSQVECLFTSAPPATSVPPCNTSPPHEVIDLREKRVSAEQSAQKADQIELQETPGPHYPLESPLTPPSQAPKADKRKQREEPPRRLSEKLLDLFQVPSEWRMESEDQLLLRLSA